VERTAPTAVVLYSPIVLWFAAEGHRYHRAPWQPWYRTKSGVCFTDMLNTLRVQSVRHQVLSLRLAGPGRKKIMKGSVPRGPTGRMSAKVELSDLDGNGAFVYALGPLGSGSMLTQFNGFVPSGTIFADLVSEVSIGGGGTATCTQSDPGSGYRLVGSAVSNISLQVGFLLSANDRTHAFAKFWIRPEPSCTEDSDGDGTADCVDDCPDDPDKVEPGACGCGLADIDSDGDGALDCMDECPNDPDKAEPGACGCGVVDTDSNGDGVPDCLDQPAQGSQDAGPEGSDGSGDGWGSDDSAGQQSDGSSSGSDTSDPVPGQSGSSASDSSDGAAGSDESSDQNGAGPGDSSSPDSVVAGAQDQNPPLPASPLVPLPFPFCGAGTGMAATLSLASLAGVKGMRRMNPRRR
jgi:hypothetical protein